MPLVVDAYNVLHVTGVLPPEIAGLDLDGLADLVETSRIAKDEVWIVCDGLKRAPDGPRRRQRVWFSWAGAGAKADDLIIQLVQRSSSPRRMTVVTSDRAVQRSVKRRGAEVLSSEEFLTRIAADWKATKPAPRSRVPSPRESVPLAAPEVRLWLRIFGLGDDLVSVEATTAPKAERPQPVKPAAPPAPTEKPKRGSTGDDPLELMGIDLAALLAGTPPPRDGARAPRRSRRDRR
jgi:predicted RNA-binding protein with PIN domain